jgi:DNA-binding PadR family transcriptional regulator
VSVTRLLVLGVVRILQPAHGYAVRRELLSWRADDWAHLNPGSVYNALPSMAKGGFLAEQADPVQGGSGPATRATYTLTPEGESEFLSLVREALWRRHPMEPAWLAAGISFWSRSASSACWVRPSRRCPTRPR